MAGKNKDEISPIKKAIIKKAQEYQDKGIDSKRNIKEAIACATVLHQENQEKITSDLKKQAHNILDRINKRKAKKQLQNTLEEYFSQGEFKDFVEGIQETIQNSEPKTEKEQQVVSSINTTLQDFQKDQVDKPQDKGFLSKLSTCLKKCASIAQNNISSFVDNLKQVFSTAATLMDKVIGKVGEKSAPEYVKEATKTIVAASTHT